MRLRSVFFKTLTDRVGMIKTWAALISGAAVLLVVIFAVLSRAAGLPLWLTPLANLFDLPAGSPPASWFLAASWWIILPGLLAAFSIELGAGLLAGREEDRELELLLAYPISRRRLLLERYAVLAAATAALALPAWMLAAAGFRAAGAAPAGFGLAPGMALVALVFGSLAFALGGRSGSRTPARWISLAVLAAAAGLELAGPGLPGPLAYVRYLSPLYDFAAGHLLSGVIYPGFSLLLAGTAALLTWLAAYAFEHREIG